MYPLRKGRVVDIKAGNRSAKMGGTIVGSGRNLVWVKLLKIKGKLAKKTQQNVVCINKKNVLI